MPACQSGTEDACAVQRYNKPESVDARAVGREELPEDERKDIVKWLEAKAWRLCYLCQRPVGVDDDDLVAGAKCGQRRPRVSPIAPPCRSRALRSPTATLRREGLPAAAAHRAMTRVLVAEQGGSLTFGYIGGAAGNRTRFGDPSQRYFDPLTCRFTFTKIHLN